jgi:hypothetical protein
MMLLQHSARNSGFVQFPVVQQLFFAVRFCSCSALEKSQHYIENRIAVLRERYEILRTPEKLQALLGWLGE